MAITKTKNIGLTKDDKTEHYSVDRVNANSDLIDLEFNKVNDNIGDIKGTALDGYVEGTYGTKSAANLIKFIWSKLGSIELTDMKIKVTTWENHTLDKVLSKLKGWIGTMGLLKTKEKSSLVGAVNEVHDNNENLKNKIKGWIGTMGLLKTKEKSSLVGAVNEVHDNNENLKQAELLDRRDIVKIKSELTGEDEALRVNNEKLAHLLGVSIEDIRGGVS
ncbi:hypothetical protein [Peptostreptococcus sp.]|uniref:hypothetical protein n=1 Tax=Peptostreptococcus sp. TaxID=1262 RepID=UPI002913088A|nr:hypothetical protein [Peptostreptococcus sp.]MDU3423636.1 hypothetical protein [Peptostreptococcus anaerobius]MDU3430491.1 hypothetical protein [Peptostreptococcus sp.]MDU3455500.1 hypothetical protein [Peptostreptococcus sp.]